MAFSARTISREMEVQMGKAPTSLNPFLMGNPISTPRYVSRSSMSAPVFQSGMSNGHGALELCGGRKMDMEFIYLEYLFHKSLTTSDVGKLNRVLIPKQCAEEYFPKISEAKSSGDGDFLNFEDLSTGLIWRFHFCHYNKKTYVLNKGWHVFIKEKNLKKGDIVSFYRDAGKTTRRNHMFIHIEPRTVTMFVPHHVPSPTFSPSSSMVDAWVHESLGIGTSHGIVPTLKPLSIGSGELKPPTNLMPQQSTFLESSSLEIERAKKRLRLFGVDIDTLPHDCGEESFGGFTNNVV